jgi:hypothetical protein
MIILHFYGICNRFFTLNEAPREGRRVLCGYKFCGVMSHHFHFTLQQFKNGGMGSNLFC